MQVTYEPNTHKLGCVLIYGLFLTQEISFCIEISCGIFLIEDARVSTMENISQSAEPARDAVRVL